MTNDLPPLPEPSIVSFQLDRAEKAEAENAKLRERQAGFLNLDAMREAMIATADENAKLRALLAEARLMCEDGDGLIDSEKLADRIDAALGQP